MPKHLAFALFLLSLLTEMNWRECTYNPLQFRHFYKSQEIYVCPQKDKTSQCDV